ncbi:MAG: NAD(P)H-dependent oxidoreductase subunit E [Anaerolineales bacterium]|nr:NAD(P)H-dependent oxidoreductase subunit E [Anaerolineales bacterium]
MSDAVVDLAPVREILLPYAGQGRTALLPVLQEAQAHFGFISEPVATEIGRALGIPLADVHGVIDFYSLLYREPVGRTVVRVCTDPSCALRGADDILAAACARAGVEVGGTSADGEYTVERSPCLGQCNAGVSVNVTHGRPARSITYAHVTEAALDDVLAARGRTTGSPYWTYDYVGGDLCIVTPLCGRGRRTTLIEYEAAGGMQALTQALTQMTPTEVIAGIKACALLGRGGAAFPSWLKWEGAGNAPGEPKYFVVNADESEPGTFKDRILLEGDPCRVIEGALICAYAMGTTIIFFYVRGEYPLAIERLRAAVAECMAAGYAGQNVLGSGFSVEIEVREGAGAYICGEETALLESIEGKRGFPRVKPPFPVTSGLYGKPTVINNVETLVKVPYIVKQGPNAFRRFGTESSTGPKLVCVSGDVVRPGLYEIHFGTTLRRLLEDLAGGLVGELQAVLLGGASGTFATPAQLDVPLSIEALRAAGLTLGSGAIMVFNTTRDLGDILHRLGRFFAHEACGKCFPCQLGTQRQVEILERVAEGRTLVGDLQRLQDVGWTMTDASLCGLGQTAASAVLTATQHWPELFIPLEPVAKAAGAAEKP